MATNRIRPRSTRLRVERRGLVIFGLGLVLAGFGWWRIDGLALALATTAGATVAAAAVLARWNLRNLEIRLVHPRWVRVGEEFGFRAGLVNRRWLLDGFSVDCEWIVAADDPRRIARISTGWLSAGRMVASEMRTAMPRRGDFSGQEWLLSSRFPLGLFHARRMVACGARMIVVPRPLPVPEIVLDGAGDGERVRVVPLRARSGELRSPRAWQPDDSGRLIDWPCSLRALARGGGLVSRDFDPPAALVRRWRIVFHSFSEAGALIRPESFEQALRLVAGVLREARRYRAEVDFTADFLAWERCRWVVAADFKAAEVKLAGARRASGTQLHEWVNALEIGAAEHRGAVGIAISDMPVAGWRHLLPVSASEVLALGPAEKGLSESLRPRNLGDIGIRGKETVRR